MGQEQAVIRVREGLAGGPVIGWSWRVRDWGLLRTGAPWFHKLQWGWAPRMAGGVMISGTVRPCSDVTLVSPVHHVPTESWESLDRPDSHNSLE